MSDLERAYRRWLFAYPRSWRTHREEEILSVLVTGAQERGRTRPAAGEVVDLLAHGTDARLGWVLRGVPVVVRQRAALLALSSGAVLGVVCFLLAEIRLPGTTPGMLVATTPAGTMPGGLGPFTGAGAVVYVLWVVAFITYLSGRAQATRLVLVAGVVISVVLVPLTSVAHLNRPPLCLLGALVAFALLGAASPAPASRLMRAGSALVVVALTAAGLGADGPWHISEGHDERWAFYYFGGLGHLLALSPLVLVPGLLVALVASLAIRPWLLSALITFVPWAYLWMFSAYSADRSDAVLPLGVLTAGVLTAAGTAALMFAGGVRVHVERTRH